MRFWASVYSKKQYNTCNETNVAFYEKVNILNVVITNIYKQWYRPENNCENYKISFVQKLKYLANKMRNFETRIISSYHFCWRLGHFKPNKNAKRHYQSNISHLTGALRKLLLRNAAVDRQYLVTFKTCRQQQKLLIIRKWVT